MKKYNKLSVCYQHREKHDEVTADLESYGGAAVEIKVEE